MVTIALLTLDMHLPNAQSLKDKRMSVRRIKDRLRSKFNVAVAETDHQELWQRAMISVTTVAPDEAYARQTLQLSLEEAERSSPECIVQGNIEII